MVSFWTAQNRGRTYGTKEVGEYALHIQCAWRIRHGDEVVVGGRDLYYPPEESDHPVEDFDWDVQGANRRDRRIAELFQNETRQFMVREVEVGGAGSFTIIFDDEYALDVFPDDSLSDEHWRIFKPSAEERALPMHQPAGLGGAGPANRQSTGAIGDKN